MAQSSAGFKLPEPTKSSADAGTTNQPQVQITPTVTTTNTSRDMVIGGGILLVLLVAFFFAKNAYASSLISKRVQPRSAAAAGWWLFVFLSLLSVGVIMAVVSQSTLMAPFIVGPLGLGALVSLVLMVVTSRR